MMASSSSENETRDTILDGRITLIQPRHGYRFSVEAILLGRFARASTRERVLDLGAGCGVVAIMMAALYRPREVVAIEIQPPLAAMIARSAAINGLQSVNAVCADLRQKKIKGVESASFDLVIANPPYRAVAAGRENPDHGRRVARGENAAVLEDFIAAARRAFSVDKLCISKDGQVRGFWYAGHSSLKERSGRRRVTLTLLASR